MRENLAALKSSAEERALVKRYTTEMNQQEDSLAKLNTQLADLQQQRARAEEDLKNKVEQLQMDEEIS